MDITKLLSTGIPVPEQLVLSQAVLEPSGRVYAGVGWTVSGDNQVGCWAKFRPANTDVAKGLVGLINGIRAEVGAGDDSPGLLTLPELANIVLGTALGKS